MTYYTKYFIVYFSSLFISITSLSCNSSENQLKTRGDYVIEGEDDLEKVQREYFNEVQDYKRSFTQVIEENEQRIEVLRLEIPLKEEDTQDGFRKKLKDLKKKNEQLKTKLKNHKFSKDHSSWEKFKTEVDVELQTVKKSLNDLKI
jgi:hypothetical protein